MKSFFRLLRATAPVLATDEVALSDEVHHRYPSETFDTLTRKRLGEIAREEGIDFATALFYDRTRYAPQFAPFIETIEQTEINVSALPDLPCKVWVAPASFYQEFPQYGGDGAIIRQVATRFGAEARLFPIPGGASVREGAAVIRETLAREADESVVLISLCKGGADSREALLSNPATARKVKVWVQICGLTRGFHFGRTVLRGRTRPGWLAVARSYLAFAKTNQRLLDELLPYPEISPDSIPAHLKIINVVAFPLRAHLTGSLRSRHTRMAADGPNDGFALLRDGIIEPGLVYPVWGIDHYFRFPGMSRLVYQLLSYIAIGNRA